MPFNIVKSKAGFKVEVAKTGKKTAPLTLKEAKAQRSALVAAAAKGAENLRKGGKVKAPRGVKPVPGRKRDFGDVVPAILEPGELVIPVRLAPKVERFLRENKLKLPGL